MRLTKENKGITLVALAIIIAVLFMVGGVATHVGIENINKAKEELLITEMEQIKHFVRRKL